MANYGSELLKDFINAWTVPDADGGGFDPEDFDPDDTELKAAWLDFEHAGRYSLKFRNQGFDVSGFGDWDTDEDTGRRTCPFWRYVTSPDVNYYDADFETQSKPAYDVALYLEAFSDFKAFEELSDWLGDIFDAVRRHDAGKLAAAASKKGAAMTADGRLLVDCADAFGLTLSLDVFPVAV